MRRALVQGTDPEPWLRKASEILQKRGARRIRTRGLRVQGKGLPPPQRFSFRRSCTVALVPRSGSFELRVWVFALWPRRILGVALALAPPLFLGLLFTSASPEVWFQSAALLYLVVGASLLLFLGAWESSRTMEHSILHEILSPGGD